MALKLKPKKKLSVKTKKLVKKKKPTEEKVTTPEIQNKLIQHHGVSKLEDAIDKTRDFAMFFSGVEYKNYLDIVYSEGVRDFLMSYEYVQTKSKQALDEYRKMGIKIFIDSGAFTYQNDPKYQEYTVEQWEAQIKRYLDWGRRNQDIIFAMANLDLENLLGVEQIDEWNRKYFEPFMLETGIPICFIWHSPRGDEGWERYCQRYPYVGFSWVSEGQDLDFNYGLKMLKVAEKHDAVVHGMGMTRTSILPKLPFYTVDSISWKSGLMYGLFSVFKDNKVKNFKKDEFNDKVAPVLKNSGRNFDLDKLFAYDMDTVIRASVFAYKQAEAYIIDRLRTKMYWKKQKLQKRHIEDVELPTLEWISSEQPENIEDWAVKLNINPELNDALTIIQDCTVLLNWDNPEFDEYKEKYYDEEYLTKIHDFWINQIVASNEERVKDLQKFFSECVTGKDDKLLVYGTNFMRTAQERDKYIEDEEFEYVDMTEAQVAQELGECNLLPCSEEDIAPEISELDDEIFGDLDIVPVRDEKGRFLKGQKKVRKRKNIYSDKFPKMFCDTCYSAQTCPEYKQGMVCAFKKMFNKFDTRNMDDVRDAMNSMIEMNLGRLQKASMFEILDGGMPTAQVSSLIDQNMRLLQQAQAMNEYAPREVVKQVRTVKSDGTVETTTQVQAHKNAGGSSILDKLFADFNNPKDEQEDEDVMAVKEQLDKESEEMKKNAIEVDEDSIKIIED